MAFSERSHRKFSIIWITCLTICSLRVGFCGCFFPLTVITCSASASSCRSLSCFLKEQCCPSYCQIHATLSSPAHLEIRQDNALLSCQRKWLSKYTIKYRNRMLRFGLINSVLFNLLKRCKYTISVDIQKPRYTEEKNIFTHVESLHSSGAV